MKRLQGKALAVPRTGGTLARTRRMWTTYLLAGGRHVQVSLGVCNRDEAEYRLAELHDRVRAAGGRLRHRGGYVYDTTPRKPWAFKPPGGRMQRYATKAEAEAARDTWMQANDPDGFAAQSETRKPLVCGAPVPCKRCGMSHQVGAYCEPMKP